MRKLCFSALFTALSAALLANNAGDNDRMLRNASKSFTTYDRERMKQELNETTVIIEDLSRQIMQAPADEVKDIWVSGERDFKLSSGEVKDMRKSCEAMISALRLEDSSPSGERDKIKGQLKDLREESRDKLRDHHKKVSDQYLRDLRNWLTVSEGTLRHANEKRSRDAAAALSPTAQALSGTAK